MENKTDRFNIVSKFKTFLDEYEYSNIFEHATSIGAKYVKVDFSKLAEFNPDLANSILDNFETTTSDIQDILPITLRFYNIPESCDKKIWKLRALDVGKFVSLKGYIRTATDVLHYAKTIKFICLNCGCEVTVPQENEKYISPGKCSCGRKGKFKEIEKDMHDIQKLVLEEDTANLESQSPRRILIKLKDDLCSEETDRLLQPSRKVTVYGIIKDEPITKDSAEYKKFILAHNIELIDSSYTTYEFTQREIGKFHEISKTKTFYEDIAQSIFPTIHGNELIKQSVFLQLIGGVDLYKDNNLEERGNLHILLVSSPGTAKSQILKRAVQFINGAKFASSNSSSGVGLIASVTHSKELGGWVVSAGVLPTANKSLVALDEIDKASKEDIAMLNNAMVDSLVRIDKADIHHVFETDTAILGAANPKNRVFDELEPVWKQIDLPKDFLDRFDLIFPVDTIQTEREQRKVANKIFSKYRKTELTEPKYSAEFVKKYIAYARQNFRPTMNSEVEEHITTNFVNLLKPKVRGEESAYFSSRLITNLIRLTQAVAKARLMPTTSIKDAEKAIEILIESLKRQDIIQEGGSIDMEKLEAVVPKAKREKKYVIRKVIVMLSENPERAADIIKVIDELQSMIPDIDKDEIDELISIMRREGEVYEPTRGKLRVID